jgi:hypothetical protein
LPERKKLLAPYIQAIFTPTTNLTVPLVLSPLFFLLPVVYLYTFIMRKNSYLYNLLAVNYLEYLDVTLSSFPFKVFRADVEKPCAVGLIPWPS